MGLHTPNDLLYEEEEQGQDNPDDDKQEGCEDVAQGERRQS